MHYACGFVRIFDDNIALILGVVGDEVYAVEVCAGQVREHDVEGVLLADVNNTLAGEEEVAKLQQNNHFFFELGMFNLFALEGDSFVDIEFTRKLKVVVLAFDELVLAEAAVGIGVADLAFVEREGVLLNVAERLVFCFPQVTVFIESVLDIAFEFKGNIELGAVSTQSSFFVRSIALRLADIVELEVEVVSEDLLAAGKAVLIVIAEQLVDLVDVERFLAAQQSAAACEVGSSLSALVGKVDKMRRQLENFCEMRKLGKAGVLLACCFCINNVGQLAIDTAALVHVFFIEFYAPLFECAVYSVTADGECGICCSQQVVQLLPAVFGRLAAKHLRKKAAFL